MDREKLSVLPRQAIGKGAARKIRDKGHVPAVIYGKGIKGDALPVEVDAKEFSRVIDRGGANVLIDLVVAGDKKYTTMVKDVQRDVVKGNLLHIDFQHVSLTEEITATIPIELVGTPAGVSAGGILQFTTRELEVRCLPTDLVDSIKVDVTELEAGHNLLVKDIQVTLKVLTDPEEVVASIVAPTEFKEEEEEVEEAAEPEVEEEREEEAPAEEE